MMGLSDGRKSIPIGLAVLIQYRSVTASQSPSHPASHVAVAITLNAKASSLKMGKQLHNSYTNPFHFNQTSGVSEQFEIYREGTNFVPPLYAKGLK